MTVRVVATVIALYGSVWVTVALGGDAGGARIPLESQAIGLLVLLVGLARERNAIDCEGAAAPLLAGGAAAMLATTLAVRLRLRSSMTGAPPRGVGPGVVTVIDRRVEVDAPVVGVRGFAALAPPAAFSGQQHDVDARARRHGAGGVGGDDEPLRARQGPGRCEPCWSVGRGEHLAVGTGRDLRR